MRKFIVLIVFILLFAGGCTNFNPYDIKGMCISDSVVYYQDNDGNIQWINVKTKESGSVEISGDVLSYDNKIYINSNGQLYELKDKTFTKIGVGPKERSSEIVGIIGETCYYIKGDKLVSLNYKTREEKKVALLSKADRKNMALTSDALYYSDYIGLNRYSLQTGELEQIVAGNVSFIKVWNDKVYYAIATLSDPKEELYDGATYYLFLDGKSTQIYQAEHLNERYSAITVTEAGIFGLEENAAVDSSIFWKRDNDGNVQKWDLGRHVSNEGGICTENELVVFGNFIGTEILLFDMEACNITELPTAK